MKTIGVLFGGKSVEHEVSVITGVQVMENLNKDYCVVPIYVKKDGQWLGGESLKDFKSFKNQDFSQAYPVYFKAGIPSLFHLQKQKGGLLKGDQLVEEERKIDCIINALHGTNGEDGSMQALLEQWSVAYTGCQVPGSVLGRDKVLMKERFSHCGIQQVAYTWFKARDWKENRDQVLEKIKEIGYPLMVKPSTLGSSIGISKVKEEKDLEAAVDLALSYDKKVVIEHAVDQLRELNISVLGANGSYDLSPIEEPKSLNDLLTFDEKYIHANNKAGEKSSGKGGRNIVVPEADVLEAIHTMARSAMDAIDGAGVVRIDFMMEGDQVYLNEINTQPGSMAFYLWEEAGLSFKDLLDRIIEIAEEKKREKDQIIYSYESNLFQRSGFGSKL